MLYNHRAHRVRARRGEWGGAKGVEIPGLSEDVVELSEEEKARLVGEVPDRRVVWVGVVLLVICAGFFLRALWVA